MRTILAITRRELSGAFDSSLAYIVVPLYLGLVGAFSLWFDDVFAAGVATVRGVIFWAALALMLLAPAMTMRLFAEERRTGSLELLATLPLREEQLVLGKYLAALLLVWLAVGLTFPYALTMATLGDLDWGPVVGGYLGLGLMSAGLCAIGTAASAFTASQILAFLVAATLGLVPWAMGFFLHQVPPALLPLVQYLSFDHHFEGMARGVLDTRDLVFWGSVVGLGLHTAVFALEQRRLS